MEEDYTPHWMILKSTLDTVLTQTPGTYKPISYEQVNILNFENTTEF